MPAERNHSAPFYVSEELRKHWIVFTDPATNEVRTQCGRWFFRDDIHEALVRRDITCQGCMNRDELPKAEDYRDDAKYEEKQDA